MFPNVTDLSLDWEASDDGDYDLYSHHPGQLRHVKRLSLWLWAPDGHTFDSDQAAEARMLLDHLHMPALEDLEINFMVGECGMNYDEDLKNVRDAICENKFTKLQRVVVNATMCIWNEDFPESWVSPRLAFHVRLVLTNCSDCVTGGHREPHFEGRQTHQHDFVHIQNDT
jgi:hypothetical protein